MVPVVTERLAVSKQGTHKFHMEKLNLKKIKRGGGQRGLKKVGIFWKFGRFGVH
jgi:hypothetical protein